MPYAANEPSQREGAAPALASRYLNLDLDREPFSAMVEDRLDIAYTAVSDRKGSSTREFTSSSRQPAPATNNPDIGRRANRAAPQLPTSSDRAGQQLPDPN